jgi:hypothetical protein
MFANFNPNFEADVRKLLSIHKSYIPRFDKPKVGSNWAAENIELWAQRTCDSLSVIHEGFNMVEGIIGQDGDGFCAGTDNGSPLRVMSNVIIFGMNKFKVDIIGHWMGNHEPGNFGLFHIAKERGLTNTINPGDIPVYMWNATAPTLTPLSSLERFPLKTTYLRRDYNGQTEAEYHFVNEPYTYSSLLPNPYKKPEVFTIDRISPNPFHNLVQFEYHLPRSTNVHLEIYDIQGQRQAVLVDGWRQNGAHLASWDTAKKAGGIYFYQLVTDGQKCSGRISVIK